MEKTMKRCDEKDDCIPLCNHCIHMKGWELDRGLRSYTKGVGQCDLQNKDVLPDYWCEDFHCFRADAKQDTTP